MTSNKIKCQKEVSGKVSTDYGRFTYFRCKVLSIIGERISSRLEARRGFVVSDSVQGRVDS